MDLESVRNSREFGGVSNKEMSILAKYPLLRGMLSYAIIWPTCSVVQDYMEHGTCIWKADWARAARYGIFGTFFSAPVFYGWIKYSNRFFKTKDLRTAVTRAMIEQVTYGPFSLGYFFFGMSVLERKPLETCINEVREKFWPTFKISFILWPAVQTLNFYFVPERNRLVIVSVASFIWVVFMAHMKALDQKTESKT